MEDVPVEEATETTAQTTPDITHDDWRDRLVHAAKPIGKAKSVHCGGEFCESLWEGKPRGPNARMLELSLRLGVPTQSVADYAHRDLCSSDGGSFRERPVTPPTALGWEERQAERAFKAEAPLMPLRLQRVSKESIFSAAPTVASSPLFMKTRMLPYE